MSVLEKDFWSHLKWGLLIESYSKQRKYACDQCDDATATPRPILKKEEALHNSFIRAYRLSTRLQQSFEHLFKTIAEFLEAERFARSLKYFVMSQSFMCANIFVEFRTPLTNYDKRRLQCE